MATFGDTRLLPRVWDKVLNHPATGCWEWQAHCNPDGYGKLKHEQKQHLAHRFVYAALVGDPGPELHHHCRNRRCVNPLHIEPTDHASNMEQAEMAAGPRHYLSQRTHCPEGHPYDEANTYWSQGKRSCRICVLARGKAKWRP